MSAIFGSVEIAAGAVSLAFVVWFFIELLRGRMSLRRLRGGGWV